MKTFPYLTLTCVCLLCAASAARAEEPLGVGIQAGMFAGDFGLGLRKDFVLGGDIHQISAQGAVYFAPDTLFKVDADYHFVLKSGRGRFYPLAGIDFAFTTHGAKLGINGGGGINFMLTNTLAAFAEVKYVFSNWDGWAFTVVSTSRVLSAEGAVRDQVPGRATRPVRAFFARFRTLLRSRGSA